MQSETVAALLLPTDFRAEPKNRVDTCARSAADYPAGTAVPETEAPIIRVENEKRVSKSECTPAGIKMVAKAGKSCRFREIAVLVGRALRRGNTQR